jgi:5-methylcytosine-specific restriction enzyme A
MTRQFSKKTKRLAWRRCGGHCEECTARLAAGGFIYDHIIAWELTRDSSLDNCQVLCRACNDRKTYGRDLPAIAAAGRKADFHFGISGPGLGRCPMPAGRHSRQSKTFHHGVRPRISGFEKHRRLMAARYPE